MKTYQEAAERGWSTITDEHQFSPAYMYNQIRIGGCNGGAYISDAFSLLSDEGCCTLSTMPYSPESCDEQPSQNARNQAATYRIASYRTVNVQDPTELRAHLASGFPIVIGMRIYENFYSLSGSALYDSVQGDWVGNHAMCVVGYDHATSTFRVINSWGTGWGDAGYFRITYGLFRQIVFEAYVAQDIVETPVTLTVDIQGSGEVSLDPGGWSYPVGTVVTLTATPEPGWSFSRWGGALSGSANPTQITMGSDQQVTAVFEQAPQVPFSPAPANGASDVLVEADLDWADAARAASYEVYFGPTNPPPLVGTRLSSDLPLATLNYGTTYYWKIVARNSAGATHGPTWSFTTESGQELGWQPLALGMNSSVGALTVFNSELIAGGPFTSAGGVPCNCIARWNGSTWQPLGSGMNNSVLALTVFNGELIAGGWFTSAGGAPCSYIARWNGNTWQPLGSGMNNRVLALAVFNGELIAGGWFTSAGGASCNYIARWNGSTWQPLGTGMDNAVFAVTAHNGTLIAGGRFETAGGLTCNRIARWGGSSWQPLGSGMGGSDPYVLALTSFNGDLIAGGWFTAAGGLSCGHVARWSGGTWQPLGSGLSSQVEALAVYDGDLIAGGWFTIFESVACNSIGRWNGTTWQTLGVGVSGDDDDRWVFDLAIYDGALIAGGDFWVAGGTPCNFIAKWLPVP